MLVCLLKGDDAGAADGAAQLSAWIMDTAREARTMARDDAKAAAILEPAKPSPCDYRGCNLTSGHTGPHRDVDGIPFAAANAKPTKPTRTLGPADDATADDGGYYCACHPDETRASLREALECEERTRKAAATKPAKPCAAEGCNVSLSPDGPADAIYCSPACRAAHMKPKGPAKPAPKPF